MGRPQPHTQPRVQPHTHAQPHTHTQPWLQRLVQLVPAAFFACVIVVLSACSATDASGASEASDSQSNSSLEVFAMDVSDYTYDETDEALASLQNKGEQSNAKDDAEDTTKDDAANKADATKDDAEDATKDDDDAEDATKDDADKDATDRNSSQNAEELRASLDISEDYRSSFVHGSKSSDYQKYIVLHDTEDNNDAENIVSYWDSDGEGVAAHFVINRDGSIVQCVPLDSIAHHAGYGDAGHNATYGTEEDGRDDMVGTTWVGSWAPDYGMNAYSVGIELVHVGGSGDYPEAQLEALDGLIAYIDAYYGGNAGEIIDHKAWRSGNSDTSAEFAQYLSSYQSSRKHN